MRYMKLFLVMFLMCSSKAEAAPDGQPPHLVKASYSRLCYDGRPPDFFTPKRYEFYHLSKLWNPPEYQWRGPHGKVMTFVGGGYGDLFWYGILNGKKAVGYNINRNHLIIQSVDNSIYIECWLKGFQHGRY